MISIPSFPGNLKLTHWLVLYFSYVILFFSNTAFSQNNNEIDRIKKSNQYYWAEAKQTDLEKSKKDAYSFLLQDILNEAGNQIDPERLNAKIRNKVIYSSHKLSRKQVMYLTLAYISKKDIGGGESDSLRRHRRPQKDCNTYIPYYNDINSAYEDVDSTFIARINAFSKVPDLINFLKEERDMGKLMFSRDDCLSDYPENCYLILYREQSIEIQTFLGKCHEGGRKNLKDSDKQITDIIEYQKIWIWKVE